MQDQAADREVRCLLAILHNKTTLRKENTEQVILRNSQKLQILLKYFISAIWKTHFKKVSILHNFREIFYCAWPELIIMNLDVFWHYLYIRTILSMKNVEQVKFTKLSNFENFSLVVLLWQTKITRGTEGTNEGPKITYFYISSQESC